MPPNFLHVQPFCFFFTFELLHTLLSFLKGSGDCLELVVLLDTTLHLRCTPGVWLGVSDVV